MERKRKLFCEISPLTYRISAMKCRLIRHIQNYFSKEKISTKRQNELLPYVVFQHQSLIRRKLGNVDAVLQNNKATNLKIAAPRINRIVIHPGETFSFWHLVGPNTKKKGYLEGLTISSGDVTSGIGGGMCQFSNLLHWMVLHSPLTITEHHHHNEFDLFPDSGRVVPFGTGTSILYNYLDYRFKNNTNQTFQLIAYTDDEYLYGQLLSDGPIEYSYQVVAEDECYIKQDDTYYRHNRIYRDTIDSNNNVIEHQLLLENKARVMYDASFIPTSLIKELVSSH